MSASLAFKGGASFEQILGSCYWKSHNTFTTFYLKDVDWQSHDQSDYKLGPVVSAQHIVNVKYVYMLTYDIHIHNSPHIPVILYEHILCVFIFHRWLHNHL